MEGPLPHHFTTAHPLDPNLFNTQLHDHPSLTSQLDLDTDPFQFTSPLDHHSHLPLQPRLTFDQRPSIPPPRIPELPSNVRSPDQLNGNFGNAGQFGILTPHPQLPNQPQIHHEALGRLQNEIDLRPVAVQDGGTTAGHFGNLKIVPNPPDLDEWRKKLFDVDDIVTLTEEEFQTYFPHVDNVYSHRSTQKYKRRPFVSHYWDCRMKGRPPGTPKSEDPSKRKRKRQARERDLCDVKIKITEYFPGARQIMEKEAESTSASEPPASNDHDFFAASQSGPVMQNQGQMRRFPLLAPNDGSISTDETLRLNQPSTVRMSQPSASKRYYTIQRVNGNGANGKTDGTAGPHKHSLEESDRIKKSSVVRHVLQEERVKKRCETNPNQKAYHKKATGAALSTVKKHSKEHELKLYGSCFCPFVQRVWIALQFKGLDYQYIEIDPYKKPDSLIAINPRGLVPALRHGDWGCYESSILMEYTLTRVNLYSRRIPNCGLTAGYGPITYVNLAFYQRAMNLPFPSIIIGLTCANLKINRNITPTFYAYLQAQEIPKQLEHAAHLQTEISKLIDAAHPSGPFFLGPELSFVDVQFAPWIVRMRKVLTPYRGWPLPEQGSRWAAWVEAIEGHRSVRETTSGDELYLDSYERYAENRPGTSQVQQAVNEGRGLP
ncbi:MAG: hypothetical protein Q9194_006626 [Teloschistes cf. exilis]